jgi:hypothetical protein
MSFVPQRNELRHHRFTARCNISKDGPDFVQAPRVQSMIAANPTSRLRKSLTKRNRTAPQAHPYAVATALTVGALAVTALVKRHLAKTAERDNPPAGQFLEVNRIRLHYVERGSGEPLVLLHGNGSMIQDFESSGLIDLARQELSGHRFRSTGLRPQRPAPERRLDA